MDSEPSIDSEPSEKILQRLERLRQLNRRQDWVNEGLYRLMYQEDLYIIAYERLKSRPGNLTPGSDGQTLDGWSLEAIQTIIQDMRNEQFQFKPVRTVYIPKQHSRKMRKLGIPSTRDKVVQEVIRMILQTIYDSPYGAHFLDTSHGFRPGRSCHTALKAIRTHWSGTNWFLEGDIEACFDSLDQQILVQQLRKKIRDERFLNLLWKLLRAGYFDLNGQYGESLAGTPQGGGVSPLLMNVYLHALDEKVEQIRRRLESGRRKRPNLLYKRLSAHKRRLIKQGKADTKEYRQLLARIRALPAVEPCDAGFIRVRYVRYCDDWLVGICGPHQLAESVKEELGIFLAEELHLTLSQEKTHITHARTSQARFLGTDISIGRGTQARVTKTHNGSGKPIKRRSTGWQTVMCLPIRELLRRFAQRGFCTPKGEPIAKRGWAFLDEDQLVRLYSSINRGIQAYYRFVDNLATLARLQYILRFSLAKTLATKFDISVKRVFARFGKAIRVGVKTASGKVQGTVRFYQNHDWRQKRNAFQTQDAQVDLVGMARRLRSRSKLGKPCCICGSADQVQMHHVRHIRKMTRRKASGFVRVMRALNRKQVPVCRSCHQGIHQGKYDGLNLSDLAYTPC
jgi:group II intron reverse transcriptase/maturase